MTSYASKRCITCGDVYHMLQSGEGFPEYGNHTDSRWCIECYGLVLGALKDVKPKFIKRTVNVLETEMYSGVNVSQVLEWEREEILAHEGMLYARRVFVPLFDTVNPGNHNSVRQVFAQDGEFKGTPFILSTWSLSPDKNSVLIEMEYNVLLDKLTVPWKEYRR